MKIKRVPLGALNKNTKEYVYPKIANKTDEYICPECNRDVIFVNGTKNVSHFRHKMDNDPCNNYSGSCGETLLHMNAKLLIKTLINTHTSLTIQRTCNCCNNTEEYDITYNADIKANVEHRFIHNAEIKIADVAVVAGDNIHCIFEILNTHRTLEKNRPEPWFELNASDVICATDFYEPEQSLTFQCLRNVKCDDCIKKEKTLEYNKLRAIDILYSWLENEISPFSYSNFECDNEFVNHIEINKAVKKDNAYKIVDIVISYECHDRNDEIYLFDKYHIYLTYAPLPNMFLTYDTDYGTGVYNISIDWVLAQCNTPTIISYFKCFDVYSYDVEEPGNPYLYVIKDNYSNNIYTFDEDDKLVDEIWCFLCGEDCELRLMQTNIMHKRICKSCDFRTNKILNYIDINFKEKDEIKLLGCKWDSNVKLWYIEKCNPNYDYVMSIWSSTYKGFGWKTHNRC